MCKTFESISSENKKLKAQLDEVSHKDKALPHPTIRREKESKVEMSDQNKFDLEVEKTKLRVSIQKEYEDKLCKEKEAFMKQLSEIKANLQSRPQGFPVKP
jgi:hypothetical protein